jgi:DNA recombination protein RmuC
MRAAADQIHAEVGHLLDDIGRLRERVVNLGKHFAQANEDVRLILISAEKVEKRASRIREVEFDGDDAAAADPLVVGTAARHLPAAE